MNVREKKIPDCFKRKIEPQCINEFFKNVAKHQTRTAQTELHFVGNSDNRYIIKMCN